MIRGALLSVLMLPVLAAGGCQTIFRPIEPEANSPMDQFDRAEGARTRTDRDHPACRSDRSERDDQPEGCEVVVRRDR